jgi:hypothetical protein
MEWGDCILGQNMEVWEFLREGDGKYLFVKFPAIDGSPVYTLDDLSTFKKVSCPKGM